MRFAKERARKQFLVKFAEICPESINFLQYPEIWVIDKSAGNKRRGTRVASGGWDRVVGGKVFWSGAYEWSGDQDTGMLPLENYSFFTSLHDHFISGLPWKHTEWFKWLSYQSRVRPVKRYRNDKEIADRFDFLDRMYGEFVHGVYKEEKNLPIVNIGRNGRIAIEDGRHRLCAAKLAKLSVVKVEIGTIHPSVCPPMLRRVLRSHWGHL